MGHRALVAVERPDGRYDCYHSHRGATGLDRESARTRVVSSVVSDDPTRTAVDALGVLDALDPLRHEALVVRRAVGDRDEAVDDRDEAVGDPDEYEAFWVLPLGIETATGPIGDDACLLVPWGPTSVPGRQTSVSELRRFRTALADAIGDAVDAGVCPPSIALSLLRIAVARHPAVGSTAIWVGEVQSD